MDSISSAELIEFAFSSQNYVSSQFEYWLSVSFAAIVAGAVTGNHLGNKVRAFLVFLYLLATSLLALEIIQTAQTAETIGKLLVERGMVEEAARLGPFQFWIRALLFVSGTLGTCWFLLVNRMTLTSDAT